MSETILSILTKTDARSAAQVQASLKQELSAGSPWFDEAL